MQISNKNCLIFKEIAHQEAETAVIHIHLMGNGQYKLKPVRWIHDYGQFKVFETKKKPECSMSNETNNLALFSLNKHWVKKI
jgi:hypothetical protein